MLIRFGQQSLSICSASTLCQPKTWVVRLKVTFNYLELHRRNESIYIYIYMISLRNSTWHHSKQTLVFLLSFVSLIFIFLFFSRVT